MVRRVPAVHQVAVVHTRLSNYDYHGLAALYEHRKHPLVKAAAYFYVCDTVTFHADFTQESRPAVTYRYIPSHTVTYRYIPLHTIKDGVKASRPAAV